MTAQSPQNDKQIDYTALVLGFAIGIILSGMFELGMLAVVLITLGSYYFIRGQRRKARAKKGHELP